MSPQERNYKNEPKRKGDNSNSIRHVTCIKPQREYSETKQNEDKYKIYGLLEYNY